MVKYEYHIAGHYNAHIDETNEKSILNNYGGHGWELVFIERRECPSRSVYYFKREATKGDT